MMRRQLSKPSHDNNDLPPVWLISFTDVIALMLTFFVLLYAMSDPDPQKWDRKIGMTINSQASFSGAQNQAGDSEGVNLNKIDYQSAENLEYVQSVLNELIEEYDPNQTIKINNETYYISITIQNLNRDILLFLNNLTPTLNSLDNRIAVVTDRNTNQPLRYIQTLGKQLREYGYTKPFVLSIVNDLNNKDAQTEIHIYPDDGRRLINR
jgi:flagellar motor protein MotB